MSAKHKHGEEGEAFQDTAGRWWDIWVRWHLIPAPNIFGVQTEGKYFMEHGPKLSDDLSNVSGSVLVREKENNAYKTQETS